jgi:hypothetical protein
LLVVVEEYIRKHLEHTVSIAKWVRFREMSAPFVNRRVKITGTSKPELNNQEGRANAYNTETMRYTVSLDNGRSVALKVSNLIPIGNDEESSGGGGGFPGMQGMPGMPDISQYLNMLPPLLRAKLMRGEMPNLDDLKNILPSGVTPMHAGGVVMSFLLLSFKFGLFKTVFLFTVVGYVVYAGFNTFTRAGGGLEGVKAAGGAIGQQASDHIKLYTKQNLSPTLSLVAVGIAMIAVLYVMFAPAGAPSTYSPGGHTSSSSGHYSSSGMEGGLMASEAYDKGYADAQAGRPHDWISYAGTARAHGLPQQEQPSSSGGGGLFGGISLFQLISLAMLGRQVYTLGNVPGSGWNYEVALVNIRNQSMIQKVFMGFLVLRSFGMSPI